MPETAATDPMVRAAEVYDRFFVPALFADWPPFVADAAGVGPGTRALDVACGTGLLTRELAARAGEGSVAALDVSPGMLAVARRSLPGVDFREGRAEAPPFPDDAFDAVVCQFGLMFFEDRAEALRQMDRMRAPGGRIAVAVWDALERTPGYAAVVALLERLFGKRIADELRAPYCLGNVNQLRGIFEAAGLRDMRYETLPGVARFPSIADWVYTDIRGWTLDGMLDDDQFATFERAAEEELARFRQPDGTVRFEAPAIVVSG